MDDQLRRVGLDDLTGLSLTENVGQIRSCLEGRNGGEVGGPRVHYASSEDAYPAALSLVHIVGQLGYDTTHFLLHDNVATRLSVGVMMMMMMGRRQFGTLPRTYTILFFVACLGRHVRRLVCCYLIHLLLVKAVRRL